MPGAVTGTAAAARTPRAAISATGTTPAGTGRRLRSFALPTELAITHRGVPIARLLGLTATARLERLAADGVIARATAAPRPRAAGQPRPRSRHPVADLVSDQRR